MKPFDLSAAKRGEKVQYDSSVTGWGDVHFVGKSLDGCIVIQSLGLRLGENHDIFTVRQENLRMAPKPPKEMWVQVYLTPRGDVACTNPRESPDEARDSVNFCAMLGQPQKVLVPDEL